MLNIMTKTRYPLLLFCAFIILFLFTECGGNGEWHDNGVTYFCPDCQDKMWAPAIGECEHCGDTTSSISFKYCYDCAKELNRCQMCGAKP
jgi:hypothetical protein